MNSFLPLKKRISPQTNEKRPMSTPNRREVWFVDLGLAVKVQPCVVVSIPASDTERACATAVPHTTSPRGTQFESGVSVSFPRPGVLCCP